MEIVCSVNKGGFPIIMVAIYAKIFVLLGSWLHTVRVEGGLNEGGVDWEGPEIRYGSVI